MPVQLTQQDISDLKSQGFNEQEIAKAVKKLEQEELQTNYNQVRGNPQSQDPRTNASHSGFNTRISDDVARWQLELNDILERAEHILRGDVVKFEDGNIIWKPRDDPENNTFNDYGVQLLMKILSMYINKNTILSDYTAEEINFKVLDFGKRLNDLVFMKYDDIGMDNEDKRKEYTMLIGEMVDLVHSAYARAKDGRERESYRKMISVQQSNQQQGANVGMPMQMPTKTRGILNPLRYISGKYH
jgi:hypothetical protein